MTLGGQSAPGSRTRAACGTSSESTTQLCLCSVCAVTTRSHSTRGGSTTYGLKIHEYHVVKLLQMLARCNKGLFTSSVSIDLAMTLAILFSLKTIKSLENGLQPHSGVTPLFSMRIESLTPLQSCCSIDADAWCKQTLI